MNLEFTTRKVDAGHRPGAPFSHLTTEAQVAQAISGLSTYVDIAECTEVQQRGVAQYIRAIATGLDTSSIETAVSAVI